MSVVAEVELRALELAAVTWTWRSTQGLRWIVLPNRGARLEQTPYLVPLLGGQSLRVLGVLPPNRNSGSTSALDIEGPSLRFPRFQQAPRNTHGLRSRSGHQGAIGMDSFWFRALLQRVQRVS